MKRNYFFISSLFLILFGLLLYSCSSDDDDVGESHGKLPVVTLYAYPGSEEETATRTVIDEFNNLIWRTEDVISVNGSPSIGTTVTDNGKQAEFLAAAVAPYYAFYPVYNDLVYNSSTHTYSFTFPAEQPYYNSVSFGNGVNPSVAVGGDLKTLYFYNLCGILKVQLRVQLDGVSKIRFLSADKVVAGAATADPVNKTITITGSTRSMDVTFASPRTLQYSSPFTIYWVLPEGTYGAGWAVQLLDVADNVIIEKSVNIAFTIIPSQKTNKGTFTYMSGSGEGYVDGGNHEGMGYSPDFEYSGNSGSHEGMGDNNVDFPDSHSHAGTHEGMNKEDTEAGLPVSHTHTGSTHEGLTKDNINLP